MNDLLIGGRLSLIRLCRDEFERFRLRPMETRLLFKEKGWQSVVGFQTRNIPHLGHEYVQKTALSFVDGLFINPVIGRKKSGDFKDEVILEAYEALIRNYYLRERAVMAILRTEMRYAGPREAIFHAIVRKNFGCTHFIVGRDHAGVGNYYAPYAAQEIFEDFPDLGIVPLFFKSFFYCERCASVVNEKTCPHDASYHIDFSGTGLREKLSKGEVPPKEFVRPEVADVLLKWKDPFVQ
jgi:sulfate adenylyltransferase